MGVKFEKCYLYGSCKCQTAGCVILPDDGCPVYRYFKNLIVKDYEDDMITMLTELKTEIEEKSKWEGDYSFAQGELFCRDLIQEKINMLKG